MYYSHHKRRVDMLTKDRWLIQYLNTLEHSVSSNARPL